MKRPNSSLTDSAADAPAAKLVCSSYHIRLVSRPIYGDRFIPSRSGSNFALFNLPNSTTTQSSPSNRTDSAYISLLRSALLEPPSPETPVSSGRFRSLSGGSEILQASPSNGNIFKYKTETRMSLNSLSPFGDNDELPGVSQSPVKSPRKITKSPYKVLDAPLLQDDFYLNLVDWSSHNLVAVGLGNSVYMWNATSDKVAKLCDLGTEDYVCSVGWQPCGTHLAVGTSDGKIQVWDASYCKRIRSMEGHLLRVGTLAWSPTLLSSGSRDKSILQRDIRAQEDYVSKLNGHKSEVCGLKWSCDNRELASGGNDNRLNVWNQHSNRPVQKYYKHTAAVKAIAWSPHVSRLLASGGGTADRCIRFWNTTKNSQIDCLDTGSQVCNLAWSKNVNELVSTHGYSQNEITVWKYPTMSKRKKGKFTSSKSVTEEPGSAAADENGSSGQEEQETSCRHCGIGTKSTPMMRRGPNGPRTLCNACGLKWANKDSMLAGIYAFAVQEKCLLSLDKGQ